MARREHLLSARLLSSRNDDARLTLARRPPDLCGKGGRYERRTARYPGMDRTQLVGLIGSTILFVGVFAPIVSAPIVGSINYFRNGEGDGVIVLVLALASVILCLARQYRGLYVTGGSSLAVLAFTFVQITGIADARTEMNRSLEGNPFRGLAEAAIGSVQLQWGVGLARCGGGSGGRRSGTKGP